MKAQFKPPDSDALFLAHPHWLQWKLPTGIPAGHQFLLRAQERGVELPETLPLTTLAATGWLRPRLRIALPPAAIRACWNPRCDPTGSPDCDPADYWAHQLLLQVHGLATPPLPTDAPWMHWLESEQAEPGHTARLLAITVNDPTAIPAPAPHLFADLTIVPAIDFYSDWQVYHLAELLAVAEFREFVATDQAEHFASLCHRHAQRFDQRATRVAARWNEHGEVFDWIARYRTIWAHNAHSVDDFAVVMRRDTTAWSAHAGVDAAMVRAALSQTLLVLWADWQERAPLRCDALRRSLQQDIVTAVHLLQDLTGEPIDPFDSDWFWQNHRPNLFGAARLVDALPNEEWMAPIEFTKNAALRTASHPAPFTLTESELWTLVRAHWRDCAPLRRFSLAWARTMRSRLDRNPRHPDAVIAANERIEQFNLVGLHMERMVRHVAAVVTPSTGKQAGSNAVMRDAIKRSLAIAATSVSITDQQLDGWIKQHTSLHAMPDLAHNLCQPSTFATGDAAADQLITAHIHALIARNYAAHHDYFDDKMIGTPAAPLLSGCLLVVVAALHSLPPNKNAPQS